MNKKLLLSVIAICCFLYQPSLASDTVSVPKIEGLTYHDARELLMNRGWLPYSPHEDDEITADNYEILSGNGPVFWDMGYHELKRCFGNGFVTCSFVFENEQKVQLEVITKGKEVKGSPKYKARVENWDLKGLMKHNEDSEKSSPKDWKKPF